jgi:MraZ protein
VLRGNYTAKIDDKGRLKIPNAFRGLIEGTHGKEVFVTSITGEYVRIYPMPVWLAYEEKLAAVPSTHPARLKFFDRINYFGQTAEFDLQGRILIHPRLRESAGMIGEVDVFGQYGWLDVWNHERFVTKLQREPYTDDDARALSSSCSSKLEVECSSTAPSVSAVTRARCSRTARRGSSDSIATRPRSRSRPNR